MAMGRSTIPLAILLALSPFSRSLCQDDLTAVFDDAKRIHLGAAFGKGAPSDPVRTNDDRLYSEVSFAATHNSYAGAHSGVGSLREQLDRGVRLLELDVHDDDYKAFGYRIGHSDIGEQVFHGGGNPASNAFGDWLAVIDAWSNEHPGHAPITLVLDMKDNVADNDSFAEGNLLALNAELARAFGAKLYPASEVEKRGWATLRDLRGKVLTVLSGSEATRIAYRGVRAVHPAVAMNTKGEVVEVHDSGKGELWYWSGRYQEDGTIAWQRSGRYDTGQTPSVDIADDGTVVEVHEDPDLNDYQLWYRVGHLELSGEIVWTTKSGRPFPHADEGVTPSVRFTDRRGDSIREVHKSHHSPQHFYWNGKIDRDGGSVVWSRDERSEGRTEDPYFAKSAAVSGDRRVEVFAGVDGAFGGDTLLYSTDKKTALRIRPPQLAFVEFQHGGARELQNDGLFFCAGPAGEAVTRSWAVAWRAAGKIARLWEFNAQGSGHEAASAVTFPATDLPFSDWYDQYCKILGCVR